jgi:alginate O-acetyltransferase complex protein AlgI
MLFNSLEFILVFMPVALAGFFLLARYSHRLAALWLALGSVCFYAYWDTRFVPLLLGSAFFNYGVGYAIVAFRKTQPKLAKVLLAVGVVGDLVLLGYFKYAGFFVKNINLAVGTSIGIPEIVLPLGISFFTFTQIAFLADASQGKAKEYSFVHYLLFVTYFPHLIAGPLLHHAQVMPQFATRAIYRFNAEALAVGCTLFVMGLFKKTILADNLAPYANAAFNAAHAGTQLTVFEAWAGALAYTLQLYFDFSGYSDMAIGLSMLFGVKLPLNFDSPYKATNIIEFWRKWHMTLSKFLRDYLYIPLGGNRRGTRRRYVNLMATMLLGGLWHGAGWTFFVWGGLHGLYLVVNHAFRALKRRLGVESRRPSLSGKIASAGLTFVSVVCAWVVFRAASIVDAVEVLKAMFGGNGVSLPHALQHAVPALTALDVYGVAFNGMFSNVPVLGSNAVQAFIWTLLLIVWLAPNSQQLLKNYLRLNGSSDHEHPLVGVVWRPTVAWSVIVAVMLVVSLLHLDRPSEFLYFQF